MNKNMKRKIIDVFGLCGQCVSELVVNSICDFINEEIEKENKRGLEKTIRCLCYLQIDDKEILEIVERYWEIDDRSAKDMLVFVKRREVIEKFKEYIEFQEDLGLDVKKLRGNLILKMKDERKLNELYALRGDFENFVDMLKEI